MQIRIRACTPADVDCLRELASKTYDETFRIHNTTVNMRAYLETAFEREKLLNELQNPNSFFYFVMNANEPIGYLKINEAPAQTDLNDPESLEIERIYIKKAFQGNGLGEHLIHKAIEIAKQRNKTYVWLGVWEKNISAIAFYQKMGFSVMGSHIFTMGDEQQTDYIMRSDVIGDNRRAGTQS